MPIYEYACSSCGHELEAVQRITADPLCTCPACHEDALRRLISQTSFVLKGSGWYVTDYKKGEPTASTPKAETKVTEGTPGEASAPKGEASSAPPSSSSPSSSKDGGSSRGSDKGSRRGAGAGS